MSMHPMLHQLLTERMSGSLPTEENFAGIKVIESHQESVKIRVDYAYYSDTVVLTRVDLRSLPNVDGSKLKVSTIPAEADTQAVEALIKEQTGVEVILDAVDLVITKDSISVNPNPGSLTVYNSLLLTTKE